MNEYLASVLEKRVEKTMDRLRKNGFEPYLAANREEAKKQTLRFIKPGETAACGGSVTLAELGIPAALREGGYRLLDRDKPGLSQEERQSLFRAAFSADVYFTGTNAITEEGGLFNVDGNGNRVAAMIYGPETVVVVAGINKIVPDLAAAQVRMKKIAAPANVARLQCATPCLKTGECMDCQGRTRICCDYVYQIHQKNEGRIKVILVKESLGY